MHRSSKRPGGLSSPFTLFPWRASLGLLFVSFLASGPSWAQGSGLRFHVSTTSDVQIGTLPVLDDATIIATSGMAPTLPHFAEGHWQATAGLVPGDVDGFARKPGAAPGSADSIVFSLLSNEGGFLDGDVLGLASGGGWEVLIAEDQLTAGLGVPTANVDVDALDFDPLGRLLFSLQSNLPGTVLGDVEDGDILRLEPDGSVTLVFSEADVQTMFTMATGLTDPIGDVQAIEYWANEILVATQSPSAYDGAVISLASVPYVFADENAMGLGGAEIDALSGARAGDEIPTFVMTPIAASTGTTVHVEVYGDPNTTYLVLAAGNTGTIDFSSHPGFGAWYFDLADPWLQAILHSPGKTRIVLDGQGRYSADWVVPAAMVYGTGFGSELGWSFQMMEVPSLQLSAPFRVVRL